MTEHGDAMPMTFCVMAVAPASNSGCGLHRSNCEFRRKCRSRASGSKSHDPITWPARLGTVQLHHRLLRRGKHRKCS